VPCGGEGASRVEDRRPNADLRSSVLDALSGSLIIPLREVWDVWRLLPTAVKASRYVRSLPLKDSLGELLGSGIGAQLSTTDRAALRLTVRRACKIAGFLGGLDSCLTRCLVTASVAHRHGSKSVLHIGFRLNPDPDALPLGHAWVTMDGENVTDAAGAADTAGFIPIRSLDIDTLCSTSND
jgi:hypothetical protein